MDDPSSAKNLLTDRICSICCHSTNVIMRVGGEYKKIALACTYKAWERADVAMEKYKKDNPNEMWSLNPLDYIETKNVDVYDSCENWSKK